MDELKKKGWYLNENGFKCCLEALGSPNSRPSVNEIIRVALNLDLHHIGDKVLPENVNSGQCTLLNGPIVLQLQKQCNISAPTISQESSAAPRMLKLNLTDGKLNCIAIEYSNLVDLNTDSLVPGTKICLVGSNINILNGVILLENNQLVFLGGEVEKLKEKWILMKKAHLLNRKMNGSGPPPFQEFDPVKFNNKSNNNIQNISVKNGENEAKLKDSGGGIKQPESGAKAASSVSSLVHSKQSKTTPNSKAKIQFQEKYNHAAPLESEKVLQKDDFKNTRDLDYTSPDNISRYKKSYKDVDKLPVESFVGNLKKEKIAVQVQQNDPKSHAIFSNLSAIPKKDMVYDHHLEAENRNRCNKEEDNFKMLKNLQSQNSRDSVKSYEHKSVFVCYDAKNDKWTREDNLKCDMNVSGKKSEKENESTIFLDKKLFSHTNFHSNTQLGDDKKDNQLRDNRKNTKPWDNGKTTQSRNKKDVRSWDDGKDTQFVGTRPWNDRKDSLTNNYRQDTEGRDAKYRNDRKDSLANNSEPNTQVREARYYSETNTYRKGMQQRDDKRKEVNNRKTTQLRDDRKDSPSMSEERNEFQSNAYRKDTQPKVDKRYAGDERKYSLSDNKMDTVYRNATQLIEKRKENLSREEKRNVIQLNSYKQDLQPEVSKNAFQLNAHKKNMENESYTQINDVKKNTENEKTLLRDESKNSPSREGEKNLFKSNSCKRDTQPNDPRNGFQSNTHKNTQSRNKQINGSWKDTDNRKATQLRDEKKENPRKDENRKDFQSKDNTRPKDYRKGISLRNERNGYQPKFDDFQERNYKEDIQKIDEKYRPKDCKKDIQVMENRKDNQTRGDKYDTQPRNDFKKIPTPKNYTDGERFSDEKYPVRSGLPPTSTAAAGSDLSNLKRVSLDVLFASALKDNN